MNRSWIAVLLAAVVSIVVAVPASALDLQECLARGLARSDRLQMVRAEAGARDNDHYAAATGFLPHVTLQAHQTWLDAHNTMPDMTISLPPGLPAEQAALFGSVMGQIDFNAFTEVPDHDTDLTLQAYQPLTQLPQIAMAERLTNDAADAAQLGYEATRNQVSLQLASLYFQALIAEKRADTLQRAADQIDQLLTDAAALKQQGLMTKADLLKIQMRRSEIDLQLSQAQQDVAYTKSYLARLLDLPIEEVTLQEPEVGAIEIPALDWCRERGDQDRPEVRITRLQERIARGSRNVSYLGLIPQVGAVASAEWNDDGLDTTPDRIYSAGFALTWNFWGLGGDVLRARSSAYSAERAAYDARATRIDLGMAVEKAWRDARQARENVAVNRQTLDHAQENFRIEQLRYQVGETTTTDLLGAQTQLTSAQTGYDAARYLALLADGALAVAIGRQPFVGWAENENNDSSVAP